MNLKYSLAVILLFFGYTLSAHSTPINLNDFYSDPSVTIAADGSSATIAEDSFLFSVLLSNDPGLGDPNVIIPAADTFLIFDFNFSELVGNDDEFIAFVLDGATGLSFGNGFEFSTDTTSTGSVSFELSSLVGMNLGLQFELAAGFGDTAFDSTVTVSNVRLETREGSVPLPSTLLLLLIGGLSGLTIRNTKQKRYAIN